METERMWGMASVRTSRPLGRVVVRMSRRCAVGVVRAEFSARITDISLLFHDDRVKVLTKNKGLNAEGAKVRRKGRRGVRRYDRR
jgi:hypothetical protein